MLGFKIVPSKPKSVDPHEVSLTLCEVGEALDELRKHVSPQIADDVEEAWVEFVTRFVYAYIAD